MKITRLKDNYKFITEFVKYLEPYGIKICNIGYPTKTSVKFRAQRVLNKLYAGGGMKDGQPLHYVMHGRERQAIHLHWEEWALVNHFINKVCNEFNLGGSCKSWFKEGYGDFGNHTWIRKNGVTGWECQYINDIERDLENSFYLHQKQPGMEPNGLSS